MAVRRSTAAEQPQSLAFVGGDLVPGGSRDEDGVAGGDGFGFAVEFHEAGAFEDEVEFLTDLVVVALGGTAGGEGGFGQALELDGGVGAVEDAADGGAVLGGEGRLGGKRVDCHGGRGIVSPLGRVSQAGLREGHGVTRSREVTNDLKRREQEREAAHVCSVGLYGDHHRGVLRLGGGVCASTGGAGGVPGAGGAECGQVARGGGGVAQDECEPAGGDGVVRSGDGCGPRDAVGAGGVGGPGGHGESADQQRGAWGLRGLRRGGHRAGEVADRSEHHLAHGADACLPRESAGDGQARRYPECELAGERHADPGSDGVCGDEGVRDELQRGAGDGAGGAWGDGAGAVPGADADEFQHGGASSGWEGCGPGRAGPAEDPAEPGGGGGAARTGGGEASRLPGAGSADRGVLL